jgi:hypothetical protein
MDRRLIIMTVGILIGSLQKVQAGTTPTLDSPGCKEEVMQVCQGSNQDIAVCLETQGGRISKECRDQYREAQIAMQDKQGAGACAADLQSLCPGTSVHGIQKCLEQQIQHLPARCLTILAGIPPR